MKLKPFLAGGVISRGSYMLSCKPGHLKARRGGGCNNHTGATGKNQDCSKQIGVYDHPSFIREFPTEQVKFQHIYHLQVGEV